MAHNHPQLKAQGAIHQTVFTLNGRIRHARAVRWDCGYYDTRE